MLASAFALPLAALALQPADTTRATREAYTACLRGFIDRSLDSRMTLDTFNTEFPQQCPQQKAAFRAAVIARESASRDTRATAEESADSEIEEAEYNFRDRFEGAQPPTPPAAAPTPTPDPAAPAAAPTPTPAPTPAPTPTPAPDSPSR